MVTRAITIPRTQAPFAGFFNKILTSVQSIFRKPPLPDPSNTFSEIRRIQVKLLENPRDQHLGTMMHTLILRYETQTRDVAMRQIQNAPSLKAKIMNELKETRRQAYSLAFGATDDPYYASKLGHYDPR